MPLSMSIEADTVRIGTLGIEDNLKVGAIGTGANGGTINSGGVVTGDVELGSADDSIQKGLVTMRGGNPSTAYQFDYGNSANLTATDPATSQQYTATAVIDAPSSFVTDENGDADIEVGFVATFPANVPLGLHFTGTVSDVDAKVIYPLQP